MIDREGRGDEDGRQPSLLIYRVASRHSQNLKPLPGQDFRVIGRLWITLVSANQLSVVGVVYVLISTWLLLTTFEAMSFWTKDPFVPLKSAVEFVIKGLRMGPN